MNRRAFLEALLAGGVAAAAPAAVIEVLGMAPRQIGTFHAGGWIGSTAVPMRATERAALALEVFGRSGARLLAAVGGGEYERVTDELLELT